MKDELTIAIFVDGKFGEADATHLQGGASTSRTLVWLTLIRPVPPTAWADGKLAELSE